MENKITKIVVGVLIALTALVTIEAAAVVTSALAADMPRYRVDPPPVLLAPPAVEVDPDELEIVPPRIIIRPPVITIDPDDIEPPEVEVYEPPVRYTPFGIAGPSVRYYRHHHGFHHYGWRR